MQLSQWQNIRMSIDSILSQKLRAFLTLFIIAIGITALVGILTAVDSLKSSINDQFSSMGANSISIRSRRDLNVKKEGKRVIAKPYISYKEAAAFKEAYNYRGDVGISVVAKFNAKITHADLETNPNMRVSGGDENFLITNGYKLQSGRNFSATEITSNSWSALIGQDVVKDLFPNTNPLGKSIKVENIKYRVIGVLEGKGNSSGFGGDRIVIIPIGTVRQQYAYPEMNFTTTVSTGNQAELETAMNEATGLMRLVRKDKLGDEDSFTVYRSDAMATRLIDLLSYATLAAAFIAIITLTGAAIGLMNMMLVSVTERTREIGTRKALGAQQRFIRNQFLYEAIAICLAGGLLGVLMGVGIGFLVAFFLETAFVIPWLWISIGLALCFFVGVVAGFYPARKAARLDPVEALRYE